MPMDLTINIDPYSNQLHTNILFFFYADTTL